MISQNGRNDLAKVGQTLAVQNKTENFSALNMLKMFSTFGAIENACLPGES